MIPVILLPLLALAGLAASATPYDDYILAPSSRTIYPASIHRANGSVFNANSLVPPAGSSRPPTNGSAILKGNASVTFDYAKNIGGLVSLTIGSVSSSSPIVLGLTYTESSLWINGAASDATSDAGLDSPVWITVDGPGTYAVARQYDRGGFRYLSIVSNSSGAAAVEIQSVVVHFTAAPEQQDLRAYTGYFHSDDELLNRIWYAGEYTLLEKMLSGQRKKADYGLQGRIRASCAPSTRIMVTR